MQNDKNKIKPRALGIGMLGKQSTTESFPLWSPFLLLHTLDNRVPYPLKASPTVPLEITEARPTPCPGTWNC